MRAVNLKTEFLSNPIGIDIQYPRLMWACEGGKTQTAYQIVAKIDDNIIWDSGKVDSNNMSVNYPHKLISRQRVEWTVTLWNENDNEGESSSAYFEMGLLTASDWKAKWIAGDYKVNKKKRYPVDCFKKAFNAVCVKKARLYITACGLYEVKLNGTRVGNLVFAPGYTDYRKRIHYQTYSKGAVCEWLFNTVCGIKVAGDRQFTVEPKVGGSLDFAQAEYDSIYGKVVSNWQKKGNKVTYSITIPTNTTAKIILPGITRIVGAGNYSFEI